MQRFLGMVTYIGKFIKNVSTITAPLRKLLQKDIEFELHQSQLDAIKELKRLATSSPTLRIFNPNLQVRLRPDASSVGLGALLEQYEDNQWHPVAYASRSLTETEKRYAQIEKEILSIVFGTGRFYEYLYGKQFIVMNDHQPLKSIFNKSIINAPPRIQRFLFHLQKYNFTFEFSPGKYMVVADALSRVQSQDCCPEIPEKDVIHHIHSIISSLPISDKTEAISG